MTVSVITLTEANEQRKAAGLAWYKAVGVRDAARQALADAERRVAAVPAFPRLAELKEQREALRQARLDVLTWRHNLHEAQRRVKQADAIFDGWGRAVVALGG